MGRIGTIRCLVYMKQSLRYNDESNKVFLLKRSLYELKKFSRCWYELFMEFPLKLEFQASEADPLLIHQKMK